MSSFHKVLFCCIPFSLAFSACSPASAAPPTESTPLPLITETHASIDTGSHDVEDIIGEQSEGDSHQSLEDFKSSIIQAFKLNDLQSIEDMITNDIEVWLGFAEPPIRCPGKETYMTSIHLEGGYQDCDIFFLDPSLSDTLQDELHEPDIALYGVLDCDLESDRFHLLKIIKSDNKYLLKEQATYLCPVFEAWTGVSCLELNPSRPEVKSDLITPITGSVLLISLPGRSEIYEMNLLNVSTGEKTKLIPGGWTFQGMQEAIPYTYEDSVFFDLNISRLILTLSPNISIVPAYDPKPTPKDQIDTARFNLEQLDAFKPYKIGPEEEYWHHYKFGMGHASPDGEWIAFPVGRDQYTCNDLWIIDSSITSPKELVECSSFIGWSSDGEWIIYKAREYFNEGYSINLVSVDNLESIQLLIEYGRVITEWLPVDE